MEKLPPLRRKGFNYNSPSPFGLQEDNERKWTDLKDCPLESFPFNRVQRRHNSATARRKTHSEEKQNISFPRSEIDTIFPFKIASQRMAFNPSNCQASCNYFIQKDKNSLDCLKERWENSKHPSNRRQGENDGRSKLEHFDFDSNNQPGETNSKSLNEYQVLRKGHCRLYENEIRLTKEIHKKEVLLQGKLLKVAERLKKIQLRTAFEDTVKSEEQRKTGKADSRSYYSEKGNWDWESARDRDLGSRRHEGQQEGFIYQVRGNCGVERRESHVKETNGQKEKMREAAEWPNRERNMQRTTKTVELEWDHFEEIAKHTWGRAGTEKDKTRKERVMEQQGNEVREWDQRDWHKKKEMVKGIDGGKKRGEGAKLKRDTEIDDEDQQWDLMGKFASNSHSKRKTVSKHDKMNILIEDHLAAQESLHQYNNRAALEKVLPEAGPGTNAGKRLQQVQFSPETSPHTDVHILPCKVCNRRFTEGRLEKHISICQKMQKPRRRVYDSSQYRAKGTDLEEFVKTNGRSKSPEVRLHD